MIHKNIPNKSLLEIAALKKEVFELKGKLKVQKKISEDRLIENLRYKSVLNNSALEGRV